MFWQRKSSGSNKRVRAAARRRTLQLETLETRATPAVFMVTNVNDSGDGSLRAAITSANSTAGRDQISFQIPGQPNAVHSIVLDSALPEITDVVQMTYYSYGQSNQQIELTARDTAISWGITLKANNSEISGLTFNGFVSGSILIDGGDNNSIYSNNLGTNPTGTVVVQHGGIASLALIHGAAYNKVSGNLIAGSEAGVLIDGAGTKGNNFANNTIGARGGDGLGNGTGVLIRNGATGNVLGSPYKPSSYASYSYANSIVGNTGAGIAITGANTAYNRVFDNLNYGNGGLPIDLGNDGVTKNDYLDSDAGPNFLTNSPVVQSVIDRGTFIYISGSLDGQPNQAYSLAVFTSSPLVANGRGAAQQSVGFAAGTSDAKGHLDWTLAVDNRDRSYDKILNEGWVVSATATDNAFNTSEFSAAFSFNNGGPNQPPVIGQGSTPVTYVAGALPVLVAPAGGVIDRDTPNYGGGYLSIKTIAGAEGTDRLGIRSIGTGAGQISTSGIQVQYGGVTIGTLSGGAGSSALVIALNKNATPAAAQALLRAITFQSLSATPTAGKRTLQFQLGDGHGQLSNNAFSFVQVAYGS